MCLIDLNCFFGLAMLMRLLLDNDIQQVSGHFSKMFSIFCIFAVVFFQCTKRFLSFGQIGTQWHTWLTEALKMVTVLHLLLKSKDG